MVCFSLEGLEVDNEVGYKFFFALRCPSVSG